MTKARIDRMESGRVRMPGVRVTTVSRTASVRISNGTSSVPAGELEPASSSGSHVTEFQIYVDGETFKASYYDSSAANNYAIAYYDSAMTLIGGIQGGGGGGIQRNVAVTPVNGTRFIRVFGTTNVEAAFVAVHGAGVFPVNEIKVKPAGYSSSIVVWPTATTWKLVPGTAMVHYSRYSGARQSIVAGGYNYAYITATVQEWLGETLVRTIQMQRFNIQSLMYVDSVTLNGVTKPAFFIGTQSGSPSIEAYNLGTTEVKVGLDCKAVGEWNGLVTPAMWVYQEGNKVESVSYTQESTTGLRIELSATDLTPSGGYSDVTVYAQKRHKPVYEWTSEETVTGAFEEYEEEVTPGNISVSPSAGVTISGTRITFPQNTGSDEKAYAVTATWSGYSATEYVYVYGQDTGRTYSNLAITNFYYPNSGIISVNGGSMYPVVAVSIRCNGVTLIGSVNDGSTAVEVSGGGYTATVNLAYYGAENGLVSAPSRGTNPDDANTLLATVSVIASKGSLRAYSADVSVYQQRNKQTVYRQGSFNVTAMTVTPTIGGTAISGEIPAVAATVSIEVRVAGSGTTTEYEYTTGLHSGGTAVTKSLTDPPLSQDELRSASVTSGGSPVALDRLQFTASNQHNLTAKSYSISVNFEGTARTATVNQKADAKMPGTGTPFVSLALVSNDLTAAGGTLDLIGTAYTASGLVWESDGTAVTGESTQVDNTSALTLQFVESSAGAFPQVTTLATDTTNHTKTWRITHRDMENNPTTDTLSSVYANNGDTRTQAALSYSVTNQLEAEEYAEQGALVWGQPYTESSEYAVSLSIGAYTESASPAQFRNASDTTYSIVAKHSERDYRDGTLAMNYYRRYTSWTASTDDGNHRELIRTEYDTTTYAHTYIENSMRLVLTDTATIMAVNSPAWITFTATDGKHGTISIGDQPMDGMGRNATIRATNTTDPSRAYADVVVYQHAYAIASVSTENLIFDRYAGIATFTITWKNTAWSITHRANGGIDPVTAISPASGGIDGGAAVTTISVSVGNKSNPGTDFGIITIQPTTPGLDSIEMDVLQNYSTIAIWGDNLVKSSNRLAFTLHIQQSGGAYAVNSINAWVMTQEQFTSRPWTEAAPTPKRFVVGSTTQQDFSASVEFTGIDGTQYGVSGGYIVAYEYSYRGIGYMGELDIEQDE